MRSLPLAVRFAAPVFGQGDKDFLAARAAFERGDRARLDGLAPKLADHVLAPYVEFWQRKLKLDSATDAEISRLPRPLAGTPLADRLRVDWLKSLGKRGQWASFAALYPPPAGEDVELTCYGVQYRRQRDGDAALCGREAALVHGPEHARGLRAAVCGADRQG